MVIIGRDTECERVSAMLGEHRVVTLVGPGGIGKTTLATEIGRRIAADFGGGVLVSELSGVGEADDIRPIVARQLGFESLDAVRVKAAGTRTLVVLDNCETAAAQAAGVAETLVAGGSDIVVLATSRVPLQLPGERVVNVDSLGLPEADEPDLIREAAAAQLFLDRATAVGASWSLTDETLLAIGQLVRQLDGLPLAIELAAARSRVLAPPELVRLLDRQLDLLARPGDEHDRHRSLRTAILTSYEPLRPDQQRFLRQLSVLPGAFGLTLAHDVAGTSPLELDTIDVLTELVDASLIAVRPRDDGTIVYRLLDSIRAFALERLDDADETFAANERYVDAMLAFSDRTVAEAMEAFTPDLLARIRQQFAHLSATINWCLEHDATAERAYRLVIPFYGPTGARTEVADLARRVIARWDGPAPLQAEAFAVMAMAIFLSGGTKEALGLATRAVEHPDATDLAKIVSYRVLGFVSAVEDRTADAKDALGRAVELATSFSAAFARELSISLAGVSIDGDAEEVIAALVDVTAESARREELVNVAWAATALAFHHCRMGDVPGARREAEAGMRVAGRTGFPWSLGSAHRTMASVLTLDEGWDAGAPHFRSTLDVHVSIGDIEGAAIGLRAAAAASRYCGDHERARALWATVPPLRARSIIRLILFELEDELEAEYGPPRGFDLAASVIEARRLLGPAVGEAPESDRAPRTPDAPDAAPLPPVRVLAFDDYELDLSMHELRRNGERVHVEPQVFDVLAHLATNHGKMITKEELLDEVWGDRFVSESALSSRIKAARQATGDDGRRQAVIRTVHGKGFTFVAELR